MGTEESLLDAFFGSPSWVHQLTCPCGATCKTSNAKLAETFLERHVSHNKPQPKTPTA